MRTAFTIERLVYEILVEAQTPGTYDFDMDPDVDLYNYNPGDCRLLGFAPAGGGLYVFFGETEFEQHNCEPGAQQHTPALRIFLYEAAGADASHTSPDMAHSRAKVVLASLYDCLRHTEFRRILTERLQTIAGFETSRIPTFTVGKIKNAMTYPLAEQSTSTVVFWDGSVYYSCTEEPGQNPGVLITAVDDRIVAVREEEDLPDAP